MHTFQQVHSYILSSARQKSSKWAADAPQPRSFSKQLLLAASPLTWEGWRTWITRKPNSMPLCLLLSSQTVLALALIVKTNVWIHEGMKQEPWRADEPVKTRMEPGGCAGERAHGSDWACFLFAFCLLKFAGSEGSVDSFPHFPWFFYGLFF